LRIAVSVGSLSLKARYIDINFAVGVPFESKVLTHYNWCFGVFKSIGLVLHLHITVAVGGLFESKVIIH